MVTPLRPLLVGDSATDADLLLHELRRGGYAPAWQRVATPEELRAALATATWDVVLADHLPPGFDVLDILALARQRDDALPLIVVSRTIRPEEAVAALRAGAADYLTLDDLLRLTPAVERAVREAGEGRARRRAEEAVRLQAHLLDAVGQAVIATDLDGTIRYWNRAAEALYGWPAAEVLDSNVAALTPPGAQQRAEEIRAALRMGGHWSGEFEVRRRDGTTFPALVTNAPIYDEHGTLSGIVGVSVDIGERKRAEEALRHSEQRFRSLIEHSFDAVLLIDPAGQVSYASPAMERILGYTEGELRASTPFATVHPADLDATQAILADLLRRPEGPARTACRLRHRDGEYRWIEVVASNQLDDPAIGALVLNMRDSTEQRRALAEIERARAVAEELAAERERQAEAAAALARLRSDFVAMVSHELRTPLTAMVGYSELLLGRWEDLDDAARREYAVRIAASADRQQQLVEDLLLAGQIDAGRLDIRLASALLDSLVQQAAEEVAGSYQGQRIDLAGPDDLVVSADPTRALQVLANLLDNAAKYSPEGSPVAVSWRAEGGYALVRVRDRGPGVPGEGRAQLFTRFGRLPGSRMRAGRLGTGLGLYLGRELARAMGGELDLEDTGPGGSTFLLRLPLAPPVARPPAPS